MSFHLFLSNLRAVLNMLVQLYRDLANFLLFPNNLRAVLNMLKQLYRDLATFPLFLSNPSPELILPFCSNCTGTW